MFFGDFCQIKKCFLYKMKWNATVSQNCSECRWNLSKETKCLSVGSLWYGWSRFQRKFSKEVRLLHCLSMRHATDTPKRPKPFLTIFLVLKWYSGVSFFLFRKTCHVLYTQTTAPSPFHKSSSLHPMHTHLPCTV